MHGFKTCPEQGQANIRFRIRAVQRAFDESFKGLSAHLSNTVQFSSVALMVAISPCGNP
jgi:hypothetical protein